MMIVRIPAFVYLGLATLLFSFQTRIIFPGHETQGQPFAQVRPRPGTELVRLARRPASRSSHSTARRSRPRAAPIRRPAHRPTLLYFYGNGMCLNQSPNSSSSSVGWASTC